VAVVARRGDLAAALRLPVERVLFTTDPGHVRHLDLWVGSVPAGQMKGTVDAEQD
jgi:DNA segregation ATPase FtsK/SpoIIIE, S-DNA-T family